MWPRQNNAHTWTQGASYKGHYLGPVHIIKTEYLRECSASRVWPYMHQLQIMSLVKCWVCPAPVFCSPYVPYHRLRQHSSSPGANLANRAERKVAKHGSRANPTFDQKHDSEPMHIRPNSRRQTLPKVFSLYEGGRDNALSNKPLVSRYVQNSDVATCQNASLLLGYTKKLGDVYQQERVKKVYAGS